MSEKEELRGLAQDFADAMAMVRQKADLIQSAQKALEEATEFARQYSDQLAGRVNEALHARHIIVDKGANVVIVQYGGPGKADVRIVEAS